MGLALIAIKPPIDVAAPPGIGPTGQTPELKRFLDRLPPEIRQGLDDRQLGAFARALVPERAPHWIDLKASLPIPGHGVYVALMVGRERRNRTRLAHEGQLGLAPNIAVLAILAAIVTASATVTILILKGLNAVAGGDAGLWRQMLLAPI
jgi:hypothetical protein